MELYGKQAINDKISLSVHRAAMSLWIATASDMCTILGMYPKNYAEKYGCRIDLFASYVRRGLTDAYFQSGVIFT